MYILFFLAVERYWFRQLYHRLESLERMSKDLHSALISVCGLDFIFKNFQGVPCQWTALFTDTHPMWKTSLYHFRVIAVRKLT